MKEVEDQGLSNFAGTKSTADRAWLLDAPNNGQNLMSTGSVVFSCFFLGQKLEDRSGALHVFSDLSGHKVLTTEVAFCM